jgi:hypothetical protein
MPAIWDGDLEAGPGHRATAAPGPADGEVPKLQWPSSPARSEPRPAPAAAQRADSVQPPPTATPREPRRHVNAARDNPDPTAEPVAREQSARWPAPSPRAGDAPPPGQQARHEMTARPEPAGRQQPRAATETEPGGNTSPERPGALSADWRDQVLSEARQPWQPAPGWPHNPSLHRPPEAGNPGAGIELSEPTAS